MVMNWKKLYNILLPLIVAAMASFFGYEKVQEYRSSQPAVTVNVEAPKDNGLAELRRKVDANRASIIKWHGEL